MEEEKPLLFGDIRSDQDGVVRLTVDQVMNPDGTERIIYARPGGSCMPVWSHVGLGVEWAASRGEDLKVRIRVPAAKAK